MTEDKIRTIAIESESEEGMRRFATYEGLLESLADLTNDKYGAASSKVLIPTIADMIRSFMSQNNLEDESPMGKEIEPLIKSINEVLAKAKLAGNAAILGIFANLQLALSSKIRSSSGSVEQQVTPADNDIYDSSRLVAEIMDTDEDSPKLFIVNLPEAETARVFCTEIINKAFRFRKNNFTLDPKVVFVFDEAQEFIPAEKKREDGTEVSSRAVERLLRHGRKYNLHGWISTQRIAHLNTNALQQLHSYFVSTMPRPYDRQLISDSFAIDDAFVERTLTFQNGDWLMTSFKATNTQNVPVFFHAINNEGFLVES